MLRGEVREGREEAHAIIASKEVFQVNTTGTTSINMFGPCKESGIKIFRALAELRRPATIQTIAETAGLDKNNVKRMLWYYYHMGWVERTSRGVYALTSTGWRFAEKLLGVIVSDDEILREKVSNKNLIFQKNIDSIQKVTIGYNRLHSKQSLKVKTLFNRKTFLKIREKVKSKILERTGEIPDEDTVKACETIVVHAVKTGSNKLEQADLLMRTGPIPATAIFRKLQKHGIGYVKREPEAGGGYTLVYALRTDFLLETLSELEEEQVLVVPAESIRKLRFRLKMHQIWTR